MIVRLGGEFFDCSWTDDDAVLVVVDPHRRERLRVTWNTRGRQLTRQQRLDILADLITSGIATGIPVKAWRLDRLDALREP